MISKHLKGASAYRGGKMTMRRISFGMPVLFNIKTRLANEKGKLSEQNVFSHKKKTKPYICV